MEAKILGQAISSLRKKKGLTQAMLAEKLSLSDKTISKWESGQGYPDITVIPKLAEIFSVTTIKITVYVEKSSFFTEKPIFL